MLATIPLAVIGPILGIVSTRPVVAVRETLQRFAVEIFPFDPTFEFDAIVAALHRPSFFEWPANQSMLRGPHPPRRTRSKHLS